MVIKFPYNSHELRHVLPRILNDLKQKMNQQKEKKSNRSDKFQRVCG